MSCKLDAKCAFVVIGIVFVVISGVSFITACGVIFIERNEYKEGSVFASLLIWLWIVFGVPGVISLIVCLLVFATTHKEIIVYDVPK
jgi:hypothetical protein